MEKLTNISATSKGWVESWMKQITKFDGLYDIDAEEMENNQWKCEIELPVINKTVVCISDSHIGAVKKACDKASILINEYMEKHPEIEIINYFKEDVWFYSEDEENKKIFMCLVRHKK